MLLLVFSRDVLQEQQRLSNTHQNFLIYDNPVIIILIKVYLSIALFWNMLIDFEETVSLSLSSYNEVGKKLLVSNVEKHRQQVMRIACSAR